MVPGARSVFLVLSACAVLLTGYIAVTAGLLPALVVTVLIALAFVAGIGLRVFVVGVARILEQLIERR